MRARRRQYELLFRPDEISCVHDGAARTATRGDLVMASIDILDRSQGAALARAGWSIWSRRIGLWDLENGPYPIGLGIGRNLMMLSSGDAIVDGGGFGTITDVSLRGWGIYGHYCWRSCPAGAVQ